MWFGMEMQQLELFGEKEEMIKGAFIDPTGQYRYKLWRDWDKYKLRETFIMLTNTYRLRCCKTNNYKC
jgi:hypothetical protein